ncbi:hypothetical protein GCM10023194_81460 [Planotetraspora phitsanulokensis]|uniref:Uncharacterized protein n=1 Tax=Planotetraspora phitsanulokensis TaxID=575192 RepID=A0A8J3UDL0_9ACTN|nr:hypothetical protein [Planotetraspora phitsanulokensis]GII42902.1 hypothetical protein Pph01_79050 [Planotetraspora phitsanulokensis]
MSIEQGQERVAERTVAINAWDMVTDEYHNAKLIYRTADPFFVRIEIEDWHDVIIAPRSVLLECVAGRAEFLAAPDKQSLRACPAAEPQWTLWQVRQGDLDLALFRVDRQQLADVMTGLYELVPAGKEMPLISWDAVIAALLA